MTDRRYVTDEDAVAIRLAIWRGGPSPGWRPSSYQTLDAILPLVEAIVARERAAAAVEALREAAAELAEAVPYNYELNYDGTEDPIRAAYSEGNREAWQLLMSRANKIADGQPAAAPTGEDQT